MHITPNTYTSYNYQLNSQKTSRRQNNSFFQTYFQTYAPNATDEVKEAWKKAEQEAGTNGFAVTSDGKLTQITELMGLAVEKHLQTGNDDILGGTNSSARQAVQEALKCLKRNGMKNNEEKKEKVFYELFLKYLP